MHVALLRPCFKMRLLPPACQPLHGMEEKGPIHDTSAQYIKVLIFASLQSSYMYNIMHLPMLELSCFFKNINSTGNNWVGPDHNCRKFETTYIIHNVPARCTTYTDLQTHEAPGVWTQIHFYPAQSLPWCSQCTHHKTRSPVQVIPGASDLGLWSWNCKVLWSPCCVFLSNKQWCWHECQAFPSWWCPQPQDWGNSH